MTLAQLISQDMKVAFGVTEPGAIAYATSKARSLTQGELEYVELYLNSGIYKNAFTCGIPNSDKLGNAYAAALGAIGGDCGRLLQSLECITANHNAQARRMVDSGRVTVHLDRISPDIYIKAVVRAGRDEGCVVIEGAHTNITRMVRNGEEIFSAPPAAKSCDPCECIKDYTLDQLLDYARTVPLEEIAFLKEAFAIDQELLREGMEEGQIPMTRQLIAENGGMLFSQDAQKSALALACGAIEARVRGVPRPAMSITGSGSHGILAMMPLYAVCKAEGRSEEELLRAVCLSCLITIYIKEYSGRLSALCGCAVAGGTGTAMGLTLLHGGSESAFHGTIYNMASSITGMICHGGNPGCVLKSLVGIDMAFRASRLALGGAWVEACHGINGRTPEQTMQNMGYVASPGMLDTEKTIVEIMENRKG